MDVMTGLQQLGLTEYEAKAYTGLLAAPGATGYEAARQSGVPRPRIYEVLAGLVAKGAAHTVQEGDRTLYYPVPHSRLLQRHREQADRLAAALGPVLDDLAQPAVEAPLVALRGNAALLERAAEIATSSRRRLFISGFPEDLTRLAPALQAAEARGVLVFALVYGEADLGVHGTFFHLQPTAEMRPEGALPAMVAVADDAEALLAHMAPGDRATGFWTRTPAVALIAAEYIRHDIFLVEMIRRAPAEIQREMAHITRDLQVMWFDFPAGEGQ